CVWGSDWPHPGVRDPEPKPDDAVLFDLLLAWAPDENVRHRILGREPGGALRISENRLNNSVIGS
ncbi:MAG TPA: amidohydrolase family protein, partial [Thermoanaerobaculia bacterium]